MHSFALQQLTSYNSDSEFGAVPTVQLTWQN